MVTLFASLVSDKGNNQVGYEMNCKYPIIEQSIIESLWIVEPPDQCIKNVSKTIDAENRLNHSQ